MYQAKRSAFTMNEPDSIELPINKAHNLSQTPALNLSVFQGVDKPDVASFFRITMQSDTQTPSMHMYIHIYKEVVTLRLGALDGNHYSTQPSLDNIQQLVRRNVGKATQRRAGCLWARFYSSCWNIFVHKVCAYKWFFQYFICMYISVLLSMFMYNICRRVL